MASAASLKIFFLGGGDNPPRISKTNNAGMKVGIDPPHPPGVGTYELYLSLYIPDRHLKMAVINASFII
jgi:hypothetical protein